jgi:nickel-dependent lactate racemase
MSSILRYGANSNVEFELPASALVADCRTPRGAPVTDLTGAASAALDQPLDFPPLRQSVVSGDRVAVALEAAVPQTPLLVSAVVSHLLNAGIAAGDISIVHPGTDRAGADDALRRELPAAVRKSIEIVAHDPAHRDGLSYLAANRDGDPIYINRRLVDADIVLPIGCIRLPSTPGYFGVNATLYPTFSDAATLDRYYATDGELSNDDISRRCQEADEIAWLLGVLLTIQVVPAAAGSVLHVVAGKTESVERRGGALCKSAWQFEIPRRAQLVVAAIDGGEDQQTWDNVGRAIAAAARVVVDDGAIALCTDLATPPGPALACLAQARDLTDAGRHIRMQHSADAGVAHALAAALERGRVYLLSRLDDSVVEDLGMAPVGDSSDIARLIQRHPSCILLGNAQFAQPTAAAETAEQLR